MKGNHVGRSHGIRYVPDNFDECAFLPNNFTSLPVPAKLLDALIVPLFPDHPISSRQKFAWTFTIVVLLDRPLRPVVTGHRDILPDLLSLRIVIVFHQHFPCPSSS